MALGIVALLKILLGQFAGMLLLGQATKPALGRICTNRIFLLISGTLIVQVLAPNVWFVYAGVAALMLGFGSKRDHAPGVLLLLFLTIPTFPFQWSMGGVPVIALHSKTFIGLAAAGLAIFSGDRSYRFGRGFWIVLCILAAFDWFSHARGSALTNIGREALQTTLNLIVPIVAMASLISRVRDIRIFGIYVMAAAISLTVLVAYESVSGWNFYRTIYAHAGLPPVWDQLRWRNGLLRASGPMLEATTMGLTLALLTLFAWCSRGMLKSRNWSWAITAVIFGGVYLTQSRNPIVGVALGIAAWHLFRRGGKSGNSTLPWLSVALAVVAILGIVNTETSRTKNAASETTLEYRIRLVERGVEEVRKHPVIGTSKIEVDKSLEDLRQGEGIIDYVNSYLYLALLSGVIGLIVGIFVFLKIPNDVLKLYLKRKGSDPSGILAFLFCSSIAFLTMSYFTWIFGIILPIYLMMQSGLVRLRNRSPFLEGGAARTTAKSDTWLQIPESSA